MTQRAGFGLGVNSNSPVCIFVVCIGVELSIPLLCAGVPNIVDDECTNVPKEV